MRLWALKMRLWKQMRFWQQKKEALFLKMRLWICKMIIWTLEILVGKV